MRILFLLFPGVELLDLAGPAQVFGTAAGFGLGYTLDYLAEQEEVPSAQGVALRAGTVWPELGPDDLVLVPGWSGPAQPRAATARRLAAH
ncbi:type 1 glutamine amidotransferase family protein, partial [Actinocorallia lasiicapitis]